MLGTIAYPHRLATFKNGAPDALRGRPGLPQTLKTYLSAERSHAALREAIFFKLWHSITFDQYFLLVQSPECRRSMQAISEPTKLGHYWKFEKAYSSLRLVTFMGHSYLNG